MSNFKKWLGWLGKEDHFHHAVYDYLLYTYRGKAMFWHTPNEGKRSPFERWKAKYLGMMAGVSDWIIMKPGNILFLELKVPPNKLSKNQQIFLGNTDLFGFPSKVAFDFEAAKKIIDEFMGE